MREVKFRLELALEHREFINGKKNGKINKIIKTSGCRILFHDNFNDYNMIIDLSNINEQSTTEGLMMLEVRTPNSS
jgi:hypothetical protein